MTLRTIETIRAEIQRKRDRYARKLAGISDAEENKTTLNGTVLGVNAETNLVMVSIDNGGVLPCKSLTNGNLKPGSSVLVSIQGSVAWVGGMPK